MPFSDTLKNPTVLIVGAAVGLVVLLANRGGVPPPVQVDSVGPGASALYSATLDSNRQALSTQVALAEVNGRIAVATINSHVAEQSFAFRSLDTATRASADIQMQRDISQAGIISNSIAANAAVAMDANNNQTRLGLSYVDANKSITIARVQADAQKSIAGKALIGNIFGSIAKVATAAIGGPAGAVAGAGGSLIGGGNNNGGAVNPGPVLHSGLNGSWA